MRRAVFVGGVFLASVPLVMFGCNALLDNDEGRLKVDVNDAALEAWTTSSDAGVIDAAPLCDSPPCILQISAGDFHTCALVVDGTVRCWGSNQYSEIGQPPVDPKARHSTPLLVPRVNGAVEVRAGGNGGEIPFTCARLEEGGVVCWGDNEYQQLGCPGDSTSYDPMVVDDMSSANGLSAGGLHACAMVGNGDVACWGSNLHGEMGRTPIGPDQLAGTVALPGKAAAVQAAHVRTCVLLRDGKVNCFGDNTFYGLGNPDASAENPKPIPVPGVTKATALLSRGFHACAIMDTGDVMAWGLNTLGNLGRGFSSYRELPGKVLLPRKAVQIGGGRHSSCAVLDDGTLWCWGDNTYGGIGLPPDAGTLTSNGWVIPTPVQVKGLPAGKIREVTGGNFHMCVLMEGGDTYCWGSNQYGELGRGDVSPDGGLDPNSYPTPARVVF